MLQFTNKFSVALNHDKSEAIINFYQNTPVLPANGQTNTEEFPAEITPVANIVMTGDVARQLAHILQELLDKE